MWSIGLYINVKGACFVPTSPPDKVVPSIVCVSGGATVKVTGEEYPPKGASMEGDIHVT